MKFLCKKISTSHSKGKDIGKIQDYKRYILWQVNVHGTQKTRIFQFKIFNNVLYLNKQLHKINLSESPLCLLCHKEQETFLHLFLECSYSSNLCRELERSLTQTLVFQI